MALLDLSEMDNLEEVYIGTWGSWRVVEKDIDDALAVELGGGPVLDALIAEFASAGETVLGEWRSIFI